MPLDQLPRLAHENDHVHVRGLHESSAPITQAMYSEVMSEAAHLNSTIQFPLLPELYLVSGASTMGLKKPYGRGRVIYEGVTKRQWRPESRLYRNQAGMSELVRVMRK